MSADLLTIASGKSTTLKAIAGLESISRGSIQIDGTGGIGICPQQNIHWEDMTVFENVAYFQRLKNPGLSAAASIQEVERLVAGCDLWNKKDARVSLHRLLQNLEAF